MTTLQVHELPPRPTVPPTADPGPETPAHKRGVASRVLSESGSVFIASFALYLAAGILLDFHYRVFALDAVSRLANGFYILYSRDPHLAAVGFVWNPGSSIADLVPLLFYKIWPPLATHIFGATLVSALSMAGMVYQVRCTMKEWGVSRVPRLIMVALLALNGMILYYGANGMSEALYLFTLVASCRYLLRWIRQNDLGSLVYSAVALGACYLVRNEATFPAVFAGLLVIVVAYRRRAGTLRDRIWGSLTDVVIFELPFITAAVGWAVVSYVITGQAFSRITVATTSIAGASVFPPLAQRISGDVHESLYMAPLIAPIIVLSLIVALKRHDFGVLGVLAVVGGGLFFSLVSYAGALIPEYFRYYIAVVPLEVLLVASLSASRPACVDPTYASAWSDAMARNKRRSLGLVACVLALGLIAPSAVTTAKGMFNTSVGPEEADTLGFIFHRHLSVTDEDAKHQYAGVINITDYLAHLGLRNGQVIVDNTSDCVPFVIVTSSNPGIFVIPNDRDFQPILADPLTFGAHYILEAKPGGYNASAAPAIKYPALWATGSGFTHRVHQFAADGSCPEMRLFRVTGHPGLN